MKQKAARNKTIDFSLEEGHEYLERCILAENGEQLKTVLQDGSTMTPDTLYDQYIIGDTFQVMKELPPNFVDLLIVDPPYNLAKDYQMCIRDRENTQLSPLEAFREFYQMMNDQPMSDEEELELQQIIAKCDGSKEG